MKIKNIALILCMIPLVAFAADRVATDARVSMRPATAVASGRLSSLANMSGIKTANVPTPTVEPRNTTNSTTSQIVTPQPVAPSAPENCRDAYRACMDEFCMLDETEGGRCACSDNISRSKKLIQEIQKIQSEADDLYTTGVEREKLGARAKLVFAAKKNKSGIDFSAWLNDDADADGELGDDTDIGQNLYSMAAEYCKSELKNCGDRAAMEETLYSRMIVADCKSFETYLSDQKRDAEMNKKTAESAVRSARLEMLDTTRKYNRGECLLAYRSCIADKGGCGVNFENCLDEGLLSRRANACEDVLDQCMYDREYVLKDWEEESKLILVEAEKYADKNSRAMCLAKIQNCLEEGCSTSTNSACLTDVDVAAGICPIITECNEKIPGLQTVINDKLAYLQTKFCENDLDACLKEKCGVDFTNPECVGKGSSEIAKKLCPKSMFPSCKGAKQYNVLVSSAMLKMDYQLLTGCINQFAEKLTNVCGTDMACIPTSELLAGVDTTKWVDLYAPATKLAAGNAMSKISRSTDSVDAKITQSVNAAVDKFFTDFERDLTLSACQDVYGKSNTKLKNRTSMIDGVNTTAKMIAYREAKNRALREYTRIMDDLKAAAETNRNHKYCLAKYKEENKPDADGAISYIRSVSYEPDLRNCHVCRVQRVCEKGGESKTTSALKSAAGGLSAGAAAGTMVSPGWGTAIGAVIGGVGAGVMGGISGGEEEFCQELESCEDINVGNITEEMLNDLLK